MKGAKELADEVRDIAARQVGYVFADYARQMYEDIAAHLDRLSAIDSAVPGEVGGIQRAYEESGENWTKELLAIVQRQAGEIEKQKRIAAENAQANQVACAGWDRANADLARLTDRLRTMQHGETEALKMMGAEKRRADELAAQLETERAEFTEFRRRLLRALKPVGIESGLLDIELVAAANTEAAQTKQELAALRDLAETLAKGISAYRWKSESVAAAWENEYGHTVPR